MERIKNKEVYLLFVGGNELNFDWIIAAFSALAPLQ